MNSIKKLVDALRQNHKNVSFTDFKKVCDHYFGIPRQTGTSHCVYKMPWAEDPRVNIQKGENGKAKPYQVKQVLVAIDKLENLKDDC